MPIKNKYVRSTGRIMRLVTGHNSVRPGVLITDDTIKLAQRAGFGLPLTTGDKILPEGIGPISEYNAYGKQKIHKDLPKEAAHRTVMWKWYEWHGQYRHERVEPRDVTYERYPRTFIAPPEVEISVVNTENGSRVILADTVSTSKETLLLHETNLILELFGQCDYFAPDTLQPVTNVRRLNWEVLPPGKWPWKKLKPYIGRIIERADGDKKVVEARIKTISDRHPDFTAIGRAGFSGYIIFGFPKKNIFILESTRLDNATYCLDEKWESLSRLTKKELIDKKLMRHRIIHQRSWFELITKYIDEER